MIYPIVGCLVDSRRYPDEEMIAGEPANARWLAVADFGGNARG
jgi:hypothetical protein